MSRQAKVLAGVALAIAALMSTGAHATNLLTNGSFETTTNFVNNGQDTMTVNPGQTYLTGWTVYSAQIAWIGPMNPFGFALDDGNYSLDLQSYSDGNPYGGVQQSVATLAGGHYLLTYDQGAYYGTSGITASAGGASATTMTTDQSGSSWAPESLSFTASGSTTLVSLLGTQDSYYYIGLDNVNVTCVSDCKAGGVPEPATWGLMFVGLAGIGGALRMAKRNPVAAA